MNTHSTDLGRVQDPTYLQQLPQGSSTHALEETVSDLKDQVKTLESRLSEVETRLSTLKPSDPLAHSSRFGVFHHEYDPDHRTW